MRYVLVLILLTLLASDALVAGDWPHWRGPSRNGVSTETGPSGVLGRDLLVGGARTTVARHRLRRPVLAASDAGAGVAEASGKVGR